MTTTLACPDETELLALAMGEHVAAAITARVDGCATCRTTLDRLQAEVASLRQNHRHGMTPASTELDRAEDHDGEPPGVGTTEDRSPADPGKTTGTDPAGPVGFTTSRNVAEEQGVLPDPLEGTRSSVGSTAAARPMSTGSSTSSSATTWCSS
jgi:hypothetical protein